MGWASWSPRMRLSTTWGSCTQTSLDPRGKPQSTGTGLAPWAMIRSSSASTRRTTGRSPGHLWCQVASSGWLTCQQAAAGASHFLQPTPTSRTWSACRPGMATGTLPATAALCPRMRSCPVTTLIRFQFISTMVGPSKPFSSRACQLGSPTLWLESHSPWTRAMATPLSSACAGWTVATTATWGAPAHPLTPQPVFVGHLPKRQTAGLRLQVAALTP
mmetsp:Transcript_27787/g.60895  ORF Transcript_27787/g.60895 Transcript_27787/m.60895 type:complete len:217 (+) Transcript_27787:1236-1886(+)